MDLHQPPRAHYNLPQQTCLGMGERDQTYFSKTKAQMMIRKETQSTTIQIMKYVLLGCKATRQAIEHQLGVVCCGTALPAVPPILSTGSHVPMPVQQ